MTNHASVNLDGVALKTNPDVEYLPGIDPYDAQVEMKELFENEDNFFAMNTEVTGGGKSMGWHYPVAVHGINTIGLFPRNALSEDQCKAAQDFLDKFFPDKNIGVVKITGDDLSILAGNVMGRNIRKGYALERKLRQSHMKYDSIILITNPQIFVQMARGLYAGTYVGRELKHFECAILDEFHLADPAGKTTLISILEEMYEDPYSQLSKAVFLSATPDPIVKRILDDHLKAPFRYITSDGGRKPLSEASCEVDGEFIMDEGWRAVMPAVDLEADPVHTFQTHSTILSESELPATTKFCNDGQTVIMVDGVKEVGRIYETISKVLPSLTVHRIDGLTKDNIDEKLETFDVLASNSAVEVGIDFEVDRILFSAPNADSFIQRLGRLRNRSERLPAHAYLPRHVVEKLENIDGILEKIDKVDEPINRTALEGLITDAYHASTAPETYAQRYSAAEIWHHALNIEADMLSEDITKNEYRLATLDRIERLCFNPYGKEFDTDAFYELVYEHDNDLLDHLQAFQSGGFNSLVYIPEKEAVQTYDPLALISIAHVTGVTKDEFYNLLPTEDLRRKAQSSEAFSAGYFIFHRERESDPDGPSTNAGLVPMNPDGRLRRELNKPLEETRPILTDGFIIQTDTPDLVPGLQKVNEEIRTFEVIAYPIIGTGYHVQQRYGLDVFFRTHALKAVKDGASVALGDEALQLHCLVVEAAERRVERDQQVDDIDKDGLLTAGIIDSQTLELLQEQQVEEAEHAAD